ncbi:hypothetical protein ACFZAU_38440 [Streptomyces sp. NPDC008238]
MATTPDPLGGKSVSERRLRAVPLVEYPEMITVAEAMAVQERQRM